MRKGGREDRRKEGRKEGREDERKEGRENRRKEGREKTRPQGRKEAPKSIATVIEPHHNKTQLGISDGKHVLKKTLSIVGEGTNRL